MEYYITKCENCGDISLKKYESVPSEKIIVKDGSICDEKYCVFNDGMQKCYYKGKNIIDDNGECLKIKLL